MNPEPRFITLEDALYFHEQEIQRAGAVSALAFLHLNGYELTESYDEELADRVLDLVTHKIAKQELAEYFKTNSTEVS